jgi:hypothetical protein
MLHEGTAPKVNGDVWSEAVKISDIYGIITVHCGSKCREYVWLEKFKGGETSVVEDVLSRQPLTVPS